MGEFNCNLSQKRCLISIHVQYTENAPERQAHAGNDSEETTDE